MAKKERLDTLVVRLGHFPSREVAQRAILAGWVRVPGLAVPKPGSSVDPTLALEVRQVGPNWVSRGAHKLEKALATFEVSVEGRRALDVGASTGGFTQALLRRGATVVYAVDVGYGQLAWELRSDERVKVFERTNVRHLEPETLEPEASLRPDLVVIDVSFIGLAKVLPAILALVRPPFEILSLIKPQFEAGPQAVGKGGVVRDPKTHAAVITALVAKAAELGLHLWGLTHSPIKGPEGNIEFLAWWRAEAPPLPVEFVDVVVRRAHEELDA